MNAEIDFLRPDGTGTGISRAPRSERTGLEPGKEVTGRELRLGPSDEKNHTLSGFAVLHSFRLRNAEAGTHNERFSGRGLPFTERARQSLLPCRMLRRGSQGRAML